MTHNIVLNPKCCSDQEQFSITNSGHLIPCCLVDNPRGLEDPDIQKLLTVSKISDYEKIEDILLTQEWINFEKRLLRKTGPWPAVCVKFCQQRTDNDVFKKSVVIQPTGSESLQRNW